MMGKRQFAPKLYYQLSLDHLVPQSHHQQLHAMLRRLGELVPCLALIQFSLDRA
jgi:hypothetical protein